MTSEQIESGKVLEDDADERDDIKGDEEKKEDEKMR